MYEDIYENNEVMLKITYVNIYHSDFFFDSRGITHIRGCLNVEIGI